LKWNGNYKEETKKFFEFNKEDVEIIKQIITDKKCKRTICQYTIPEIIIPIRFIENRRY